jgi:hypothetical protein
VTRAYFPLNVATIRAKGLFRLSIERIYPLGIYNLDEQAAPAEFISDP